MAEHERDWSQGEESIAPAAEGPEDEDASQQLELAVPSLETALQSPATERLDWHLGRGVVFTLGERGSSLELYPHVVRVTVSKGQLTVPRRAAEVAPEGVVFQDPHGFFLSVGPNGEVLFQYQPPSPATEASSARTDEAVLPRGTPPLEQTPTTSGRRPSRSPAAEAKEKAKSERYVGRMGEVKTHTTRQGKLVAEVELTVADPDRPGSSKLVKLAAFGEKAEALQRNYEPGQEVTAVGIPHELRRRSKDGREWVERQLYLVQLPKVR